MSDRSNFETRLATALQRRADAAPTTVDAVAVTRAAAAAHPSMSDRLFRVPGWNAARPVLLFALLALLVTAGVVIGSSLLSPAPRLHLGRLVPAGEMTVEREGHTATRLQDGRVLVVGGDESPSADLYDPTTNTFTRAGTMSTAQRFGMAAALLQDGRVLVVGGASMDGSDVTRWPLTFGELFDPATGTFSRTGAMVQPRQYLRSALTLPDGRVLVVGGDVPDAAPGATSSDSSRAVAQVELFDPATGLFEAAGSLLTGRSANTLSLLADGRVLVAGGWGPDGPIASAEIYDPGTGVSVRTGDMTTARANHAAVALDDGRVLVIAGNGADPDAPTLASVEIYDPAKGTFEAAGRLITERSGATAARLDDGRILVAGGSNGDGDPRTVELFDVATGTSAVVGRIDPGQDRYNSGSVVSSLLLDGSVLLTGGNGVLATRFDPTLPAAAVPVAIQDAPVGFAPVAGQGIQRTGHTATRLANGRVLIAGGLEGGTGTALASAEIFDPATGAMTATGSMGVARSGHVAAPLPDGRVLVVGGLDGWDSSAAELTAEVYDPVTGTFSPTGDPIVGRARRSLGSIGRRVPEAIPLADGRVLIVGGDPVPADEFGYDTIVPWSAEMYDPSTGQFSLVVTRSEPLPGVQSATLLPDGRVLMIDRVGTRSAAAEIYDPMGDTWTPAGTTGNGRVLATTTGLPDGRVLVTGGADSGRSDTLASAVVWATDGTLPFTSAGEMAAARSDHAATVLPDGRVLVTGGRAYRSDSAAGEPADPGRTAELWDPATDTFSPAGTMAATRVGHTATLLEDGRVLLVGGVVRQPDRDVPDPPAAELYVGP